MALENPKHADEPGTPPAPEAEVREVKVKLPTEQVLRLHLARMTRRTSVSQIVSTALTRYFDDLAHGR